MPIPLPAPNRILMLDGDRLTSMNSLLEAIGRSLRQEISQLYEPGAIDSCIREYVGRWWIWLSVEVGGIVFLLQPTYVCREMFYYR